MKMYIDILKTIPQDGWKDKDGGGKHAIEWMEYG